MQLQQFRDFYAGRLRTLFAPTVLDMIRRMEVAFPASRREGDAREKFKAIMLTSIRDSVIEKVKKDGPSNPLFQEEAIPIAEKVLKELLDDLWV